MREIEIKLKIKNLSSLEEKLEERGCILSKPIRQDDTIYSLKGSRNEFENAKEGDIILRIRREGRKTELNLKQQRSSESDNLEYESEIKNHEAVHQMLLLLHWHPAIEVKKVRRKGKLEKYEICLDRVEELGDFVELEKITSDDADPEEVREELFEVLEKFGLSREDEEIKGYDTQLYQLHKSEKQNPN